MRLVRFSRGTQVSYGEWEGDRVFPFDGDPFAGASRTGESWGIGEVELLAPVAPPHVLVTMGGYLPEGVDRVPADEEPWLIPKLTPQISGADAVVAVPGDVKSLWVEVELAIVIGRTVRSASLEEAREAIFGFTCMNDVTARLPVRGRRDAASLQGVRHVPVEVGGQLRRPRPVHPNRHHGGGRCPGLRLTTHVNGELVGEGNTRAQKFAVSRWVSFASAYMTLQPGDVISLGTPCPCDVAPGDVAELEVEGIGSLRCRTVAREP